MIAATNGDGALIADCIVTGKIADSGINFVLTGRNYGYIENCIVQQDDGSLPARVLQNGLTNPVIRTAYLYNCLIFSPAEMTTYAYEGFSTSLWEKQNDALPNIIAPKP